MPLNCHVMVPLSIYAGTRKLGLSETIKSLKHQTKIRMAIILFFDGPVSDDVTAFVDELTVGGSIVAIDVIKESENRGLYFGLNRAIDHFLDDSKYKDIEFVGRMDTDDVCSDERFYTQISFLKQNSQIDLVGSAAEYIDSQTSFTEKKPLLHRDIVSYSEYLDPFIHPTVVFRRKVFESGVRYSADRFVEDTILWHEIIMKDFRLANIDLVIYQYRFDHQVLRRRASLGEIIAVFRARWRIARERKLGVGAYLFMFLRAIVMLSPKSVILKGYRIRNTVIRLMTARRSM